jgi:hypothetical protein
MDTETDIKEQERGRCSDCQRDRAECDVPDSGVSSVFQRRSLLIRRGKLTLFREAITTVQMRHKYNNAQAFLYSKKLLQLGGQPFDIFL